MRGIRQQIHNFNQCVFQYKLALDDLKKFEESDSINYMKGYLVVKREKRKFKAGIRIYTGVYLIKVDYIDGKPRRYERYVKREEVEIIREKLANKKENRQRYAELKKRVKALWALLQRYMRKEKIDEDIFDKIKANWREHDLFKQTDKHDSADILTVLGEKVRSRGECIVANAALALNIPYLYEHLIRLCGFDDRDDIFDETARPDFMFFVKGNAVILELNGMTGLKEYDDKWERKQRHYVNNSKIKFVKGKNLICVACKDRQNINSQRIAQVLFDMVNGTIPKKTVWV